MEGCRLLVMFMHLVRWLARRELVLAVCRRVRLRLPGGAAGSRHVASTGGTARR